MSLVTLTPDDYFVYWQEVIKKGIPIPESVQTQLNN
jgi:hypothetical protein